MDAIALAEKGLVPDSLVRFGIRRLCQKRLMQEGAGTLEDIDVRQRRLLQTMREQPIAIETEAANTQHYEVPARLFELMLGKHLKYSCALFRPGVSDLDQAEQDMLETYGRRAELEDGQEILELGCGWGSLTLWMGAQYPDAKITAISNSASQKAFIDAQAQKRGLTNITVITANVATIDHDHQYDRVVSIEMFEHMRNYAQLHRNVRDWLKPGGKLFVHIFCHATWAYFFETDGNADWMARYFFTGGQMPAIDTLLHFQDDLKLEQRWRVSGVHYEKTANAWLNKLDQNRESAMPVLQQTYGDEAKIWLQRWRIFHMACAELFGMDDGKQWFVAHYRFVRPT